MVVLELFLWEKSMSVHTIPTAHTFKERVRAGIIWLDENAPEDWRYRLFGTVNGELVFRMSILSATNSVLPLAFTGEHITTHMSHCGIAHHFKFTFQEIVSLGFHAGHMRYVNALESAWEEILREEIEEDGNGSLR
jgi:hypothetical protein